MLYDVKTFGICMVWRTTRNVIEYVYFCDKKRVSSLIHCMVSYDYYIAYILLSLLLLLLLLEASSEATKPNQTPMENLKMKRNINTFPIILHQVVSYLTNIIYIFYNRKWFNSILNVELLLLMMIYIRWWDGMCVCVCLYVQKFWKDKV